MWAIFAHITSVYEKTMRYWRKFASLYSHTSLTIVVRLWPQINACFSQIFEQSMFVNMSVDEESLFVI